jgi:mono/diheme cytochrome c family protein
MNIASHTILLAATLFVGVLIVGTSPAQATTEGKPEATPDLSPAYLDDPANVSAGKRIWEEQCRHCHGRMAYPGKAPKLKPRRYKPAFVFKRVTKGFRKMPAWQDVFTREERMNVVAYVLSKGFAP